MKILKVAAFIVVVIALCFYTLPMFGSNTADVDVTVTMASGPPVVQTVSIVTGETSFTANGYISSLGGAYVYERGFCYIQGESGDPIITDSLLYESGNFTVGAYALIASGLPINTPYRVRAYAINSLGISYGDTISTITTIPDNMVVITGTGTIPASVFAGIVSVNISSIKVSVSANVVNDTEFEINR
jgi:hypothetical protein